MEELPKANVSSFPNRLPAKSRELKIIIHYHHHYHCNHHQHHHHHGRFTSYERNNAGDNENLQPKQRQHHLQTLHIEPHPHNRRVQDSSSHTSLFQSASHRLRVLRELLTIFVLENSFLYFIH